MNPEIQRQRLETFARHLEQGIFEPVHPDFYYSDQACKFDFAWDLPVLFPGDWDIVILPSKYNGPDYATVRLVATGETAYGNEAWSLFFGLTASQVTQSFNFEARNKTPSVCSTPAKALWAILRDTDRSVSRSSAHTVPEPVITSPSPNSSTQLSLF